MQKFVGSSQWWDQEYHTAPSNMQQPAQNLMQCNSVTELAPISSPVLPPKFEDLLTLRLCMNPKFNDPNCHISKQGLKQVNLPDQVHNETAIHMRMTKLRPFLEAQNFHHKLRILLKAVIGCKSSLDTRQSHDYLQ